MQCLRNRHDVGAGSFRRRLSSLTVIQCALLAIAPAFAPAAEIDVTLQDPAGNAVADAVIVAQTNAPGGDKRTPRTEVMDQRNMQFVPNIVVLQTGSAVDFPNSDQIRHQVYSFSAPKTFQLALYAGRHYPPVVFDRPGLVTVGCNIHDTMIGYIYVTDSPFFGRSDEAGRLALRGLPLGAYTLKAWHPRFQGRELRDGLQRQLTLADNAPVAQIMRLTEALRPDGTQPGNKRWVDY